MSLVTSCHPSSEWQSSSKSKAIQFSTKFISRILILKLSLGLCEVSQQQNETQTVGNSSMSSQQQQQQQQPLVADQHQQNVVPLMNTNNYVNDASMTTVMAASLGVPNNTSVVSMATMTQPIGQLPAVSQQQAARPTYSPSYRGRPRGRRPSGTGRGGWTGPAEKRSAASAGLNAAGGIRKPTRGTYRGSWPSNRSPSKASPTGSNQNAVHGNNNSQGIFKIELSLIKTNFKMN